MTHILLILAGWLYALAYRMRPPSAEPYVLTIRPIELDREDDGRWIAEIPSISGVIVYGATRDEAIAAAKALYCEMMEA